jgi:hypothetical protein
MYIHPKHPSRKKNHQTGIHPPSIFLGLRGRFCLFIIKKKKKKKKKKQVQKRDAPVEKGNIRKIHENHPRRDVLPVLMRDGDSAGRRWERKRKEKMRGVADERHKVPWLWHQDQNWRIR